MTHIAIHLNGNMNLIINDDNICDRIRNTDVGLLMNSNVDLDHTNVNKRVSNACILIKNARARNNIILKHYVKPNIT